MKDARLIEFRRRALRDPKLSGNAARLIALLAEWIYLEPIGAEEEFAMPWSRVACWTGAEKKDTIYRWFGEVESAGYVKPGELRGCPPTRRYFLLLKAPKNGGFEAPQNGAIKAPEKGAIKAPEKGANPISIPFRKELESQRESIGSLRSKDEGGGKNSSLRSKTEGEATNSALRANAGADDAALLDALAKFKTANRALGLGSRDGDKGAFSEREQKALPAKAQRPAGPKPRKPKP